MTKLQIKNAAKKVQVDNKNRKKTAKTKAERVARKIQRKTDHQWTR